MEQLLCTPQVTHSSPAGLPDPIADSHCAVSKQCANHGSRACRLDIGGTCGVPGRTRSAHLVHVSKRSYDAVGQAQDYAKPRQQVICEHSPLFESSPCADAGNDSQQARLLNADDGSFLEDRMNSA